LRPWGNPEREHLSGRGKKDEGGTGKQNPHLKKIMGLDGKWPGAKRACSQLLHLARPREGVGGPKKGWVRGVESVARRRDRKKKKQQRRRREINFFHPIVKEDGQRNKHSGGGGRKTTKSEYPVNRPMSRIH